MGWPWEVPTSVVRSNGTFCCRVPRLEARTARIVKVPRLFVPTVYKAGSGNAIKFGSNSVEQRIACDDALISVRSTVNAMQSGYVGKRTIATQKFTESGMEPRT